MRDNILRRRRNVLGRKKGMRKAENEVMGGAGKEYDDGSRST